MDSTRYGESNDGFGELFSAEAALSNGSVVVCGDMGELLAEWVRRLVSPN